MKTLYLLKKSTVASLIFLVIGCGPETLAIVFIPAFAATWNVENNLDYRIDLQPDEANKGVHAGVFEGQEEHDTNNDLNENPLSGSFDGLEIEFTIQRPNNVQVHYSGKMIPVSDEDHTIVRIELNSSEGSLVLAND